MKELTYIVPVRNVPKINDKMVQCSATKKGVQKLDKKWHSLQKNPKDLLEPHSTVLDENGDKITYHGGYKE